MRGGPSSHGGHWIMERRLENDQLFKVVKNFHEKESVPSVSVQLSDLLPRLREYQEKAVQWMLKRETQPIIEDTFLDFVDTDDNSTTSSAEISRLHVTKIPTGGILSDEMGLGKTVEVLACILNNPRVGIEIPKQSRKMVAKTREKNVEHDEERDEEDDDFDQEVSERRLTVAQMKRDREARATRIARGEGDLIDASGLSDEVSGRATSGRKINEAMRTKKCGERTPREIDEGEIITEVVEVNSADVVAGIVKKELSEEKYEVMETNEFDAPEKVVSRENVDKEADMEVPKSKSHAIAMLLKEENESDDDKKTRKKYATGKKGTGRKQKKEGVRKTVLKRGKPKEDPEWESSTSEKKTPASRNKQLAQEWYLCKLSEVDKNPIRAFYESLATTEKSSRDIIVQCVCGELDEVNLISCKKCSRWLHKKCIGALHWCGSQPIYCPQCWLKQNPVSSRATLIISPKSICGQWLKEIKKHISQKASFKVHVYNGVKVDGFSQPYDFSDYDVVLTTYDVLRAELDLVEVHEGRRLRFEKRYFSPTCPLLCVDFWRICLDEAQMVEGHATKAADMVSRLVCVHRWAVTGTPIQKSLQDLYGLVLFLCIEPYWKMPLWNEYLFHPFCNGNKNPLYTLLAHIMWRSSKTDVLDQIQIPPQTELLWWQNFSPVEEHFYLRTHQECSNDFLERLSKFESLDYTLASLQVLSVNKVLAPLLRLRQACSHPQAVRGNVITTQKSAMTMIELLESLIKKTIFEAQDALRKHIASLNGMAGLHILCNEFVTAAEKYREVLRITEDYKGRVKVDTLQSIHTLHNLAELIEEQKGIIPPTLRDHKLHEESKELEEKYLSKAQSAVVSVEENLVDLSEAVNNLEEAMSDQEDDSNWWVELCNLLDREEMLMRVHDALVNHRKSIPDVSCTSIINKISTVGGLQATCYQWLENLEKNQKSVRKSLQALKAADNITLMNSAVDCHLRISNLKSKARKALCPLCACENVLKKYEMDLFDIKSKKNENIMVGDVYLLGQGKEGSWKPSEQETVLKTILAFGKNKKASQDLVKTGSLFFKLMDALRKEFKPLRLLWSRINERTQAQDELNMCKLRLRFRFPDEMLPGTPTHVNKRKKQTSNLSSNLDTKMENLHVIEPHQIEGMSHQNQLEAISAMSELKKKSGTVAYLQNLRKRGDSKSNAELCPVCQNMLEKSWAVLSCGHCYCMDCVSELFKKKQVQCAICRESTGFNEVSFVNLPGQEEGEGDAESADLVIPSVQGSHSTKVEAVIRRIFNLRAADPHVKVLIFSTWNQVLDVLEEALRQNGVNHLRLKPGSKYEATLEKFKNVEEEETVTALLLLVKLGSKGLNLIEATHIMMVEPLLNPAEELQAIGRVHRIGQTRPTYVHRFLIKKTIEERMFSAVQATGRDQWSGQQITLRQLKDLFSSTTPTMSAPQVTSPSESNPTGDNNTIN